MDSITPITACEPMASATQTPKPDATTPAGQEQPTQKPPRLMSLDALRGFDMFWITGGQTFVLALTHALGLASLSKLLETHMKHVGWDGYVAWDLIFPLFVFITGVTMPFSLGRRLQQGHSRLRLFCRVARRMVLLVLLGMLPGLLSLQFATIRYPSVLGFIGLAYFCAALIFMNTTSRGRLVWAAGLLIGYWAALFIVPVPGFGPGVITPGGVLNGYVDYHLLPGKLYLGVFDPEGLLAIVAATALVLIGSLAGQILCSCQWRPRRQLLVLTTTGCLLLALGHLWALHLPIIKAIWSSSFVLVAAGWSMLLLALFYLLIDVWRLRAWAFAFIPIGMNAITIYVIRGYVDFDHTATTILGSLAQSLGSPWNAVALAAAVLIVQWLFLYFLYRKRTFLRV